jgi:hypothetical protein
MKLFCAFFILIITFVKLYNCDSMGQWFDLTRGKTITSSFIQNYTLGKMSSSRHFDCLAKCGHISKCVIVLYNKETLECDFLTAPSFNLIYTCISSNKMNIYAKRDPLMDIFRQNPSPIRKFTHFNQTTINSTYGITQIHNNTSHFYFITNRLLKKSKNKNFFRKFSLKSLFLRK